MKPLFYVLALVATLGGAFYSYKLSERFTEQQKLRLDANTKNTELLAQEKKTLAELSAENTLLTKAQDDQTATELAISSLKSAESGLKHDIATLETTLEEQKAQFDQLNKAIEAVTEALKGLGEGVNLNNIADKVKELNNKKLELEKKRDDLAANIDGATKTRDAKKAESVRLADVKTKRDSRIRQNSMESVITAVNQEWGFVMVGAGSNTGFTPQTKLLVQRDGHLIGKLQPTSIEPNQTLADIDFDSLAAGVRLQPGDKVILAEPATN